MSLADNKCVPCRGGVPALPNDRVQALLKELGRGWSLNGAGHLERLYTFKDFAQALGFVNKVGAIAEAEGHHPDLYLAWGKCKVEGLAGVNYTCQYRPRNDNDGNDWD